jgi:predicted AlkP superfamily pyrophosphatase or phosphodiesterase
VTLAGVALLATALLTTPVAAGDAREPVGDDAAGKATKPTRVVLIVLDQLRPEFIDAFDMTNVRALMAGGTNFENAYLGHMASETVISHNVMTSGMWPKHMGWSDEWYRDTKGVLGVPDAHYVTGSMSSDQFDTLIMDKGYKKLPDYLHQKFPGTVVAAIGSKSYATYTMGGPTADIRITYSSRNFDCDNDGDLDWRGPTGTNVPSYISEPECGRFYLHSDRAVTYGTGTTSPAWMYPLEGNRDIPGTDPAHLGGDVWVADAAMEVMEHENWSGMLLTLGGIDKSAHMWGGLNDVPPYPPGAEDFTHLAAQAQVADEQLGRILAKLEELDVADETLVVLTTDHGQLQAKNYFGTDGPGRGNFNWYYGADADETYLSPQPEIQRLVDETGNVRMSMQDSAIRTWLVDTSWQKKREAAEVMATLGGVRASYFRKGNAYRLYWRAPNHEWDAAELAWFRKRAQQIVNTEAAPYGPDVIGLLADDTSYGVAGDHGGAQESVQRIPIVFAGESVRSGATPRAAIRSVDITPTILRELGISFGKRVDGRPYPLP